MAARPPEDRSRRSVPTWDDCVLPLPRQTAARIDKRPSTTHDNVGLWLDKLVWRKRPSQDLKGELRAFSLGQLCQHYGSRAGAEAIERLKETATALHGEGRVRVFRAELEGRLLVGYGRRNAAETALTFHRTWGVPLIPGSALKGITRARSIQRGAANDTVERRFGAAGSWARSAESKSHEDAMEDIPKPAGNRGHLVFHDALPEKGQFELGMDVLTPHMRDYYEGNAPPADWLSPEPFTFVTVVRCKFVFVVGVKVVEDSRRPLDARERDAEEDLSAGVEALKSALEEDGVGAKTAAGYGRFPRFEEI